MTWSCPIWSGFEESMVLECVLFVSWVDTEISVGVILAASFGPVGAVVSDGFVGVGSWSWSVVFLKAGPTVATPAVRTGAVVEIAEGAEGVVVTEITFTGIQVGFVGAYLASRDGAVGCDELEDGLLSAGAAGANGLVCVEVGILGGSWDMVVCVGAGAADGEKVFPTVGVVVDTSSSEGASMLGESACVSTGIVKPDVDWIPASIDSAFRECDSGIVAQPWASGNAKTMHVDITRTSEHDHVSTKMGVPLNFDADRKL